MIPTSTCLVAKIAIWSSERSTTYNGTSNRGVYDYRNGSGTTIKIVRTPKSGRTIDTRTSDATIVYCTLAEMARKANGSLFESKMKRYEEEKGINEDDAEAKAESKLRGFEHFYAIIGYFMNLQYGPIHKKIMDAVYEYMDDGHGRTNKSIRMAVKANKHVLEEFLDSDEESDAPEEKESVKDEGTD
jgi:hypothetical protein